MLKSISAESHPQSIYSNGICLNKVAKFYLWLIYSSFIVATT